MKMKNIVPFRKEREEGLARHEQDPFYALQDSMNRLFSDFMGGFNRFTVIPREMRDMGALPRLDVSEDEKAVTVTAELPGMNEKEVELLLTEKTLTIKGEKKMEKEDEGKEYYRSERSYGTFCRSLTLPAPVDRDKVEALFKNGVLKVTLPKTGETLQATKKIEVKTS